MNAFEILFNVLAVNSDKCVIGVKLIQNCNCAKGKRRFSVARIRCLRLDQKSWLTDIWITVFSFFCFLFWSRFLWFERSSDLVLSFDLEESLIFYAVWKVAFNILFWAFPGLTLHRMSSSKLHVSLFPRHVFLALGELELDRVDELASTESSTDGCSAILTGDLEHPKFGVGASQLITLFGFSL